MKKQTDKWSRKKLTTEEFVERSKSIHGDLYDYTQTIYVNNMTKVKIICKEHGLFWQRPNSHSSSGDGCPQCGDIAGRKKCTLTKDEFLQRCKEVHGNKYNYSKSIYVKGNQKIEIICKEHGSFWQQSLSHLQGHGCYECGVIEGHNKRRLTQSEFIEKSKLVHKNKGYDYSKVCYTDNKPKVKIICPIHGVFRQSPHSHLQGSGCPKCNTSKGELKIINWLDKERIEYIHQKTFADCKGKTKWRLKFDFFLPKKNILIEFDGTQHFQAGVHFGNYIFTQKDFDALQKRDQVKNDYAKNNGYKLVRIPYTKMNDIDNILEQEIMK